MVNKWWECKGSEFSIDRCACRQYGSVQSLSRVRLFVTPWIAARQASLSITNSWSSLKLMSIESVMPSSRLILCHPVLLLSSIPPSIRVFSNESALCMRWPKSWSSASALVLPMWSNSKSKPCPFTVLISMPTAKLHDQLTTAISSVQSSSVAQSSPTLCDPMNCSTPGLPVHHQLPEFTQIHIHRVIPTPKSLTLWFLRCS